MSAEALTSVNLTIGWIELFGPQRSPPAAGERRQRWACWLRLVRKSAQPELATFWAREHECHDCLHRSGGWCQLQQLPCTVNPILTFRTDYPGLACMGLGRKRKAPEQLDLLTGV